MIEKIRFFWNLNGIVFFAGYPYLERQGDGYFKRVQMIDRLFTDRWRIYIESGNLYGGSTHWFDQPQEKTLVLRISGGLYRQMMIHLIALLIILKCKTIYFHSILAMKFRRIEWLLNIPGLTKVIDIHGVVTEEFRLNRDFYSAMKYEHVEQIAVNKSDLIIVVSKNMEDYLIQKHKEKVKGEIITLPMYFHYHKPIAKRPYINKKPIIIYAGGLQKWQQVSTMLDIISRTVDKYEYRIYCPEPFRVREMVPKKIQSKIHIDYKPPQELISIYSECHYGFVLREDNIVNQVACPTKLMEYLGMGIVPVVNTSNIGDFSSIGMQAVKSESLLQGFLPNETQRIEMARQNLLVYNRLGEIYKQGVDDIRAII